MEKNGCLLTGVFLSTKCFTIGGDRTRDSQVKSLMLYQLSYYGYAPVCFGDL